MKILIVDDQKANRLLLAEMLGSLGDCTMAEDGQEALEFFGAAQRDGQPFDLVLMDIMMPTLDGKSAVKQLRGMEERRGVLPKNEAVVIMVSALGSPHDVVQSFYECGCTDYIVKPVLRQKLLEKLKQYHLVEGEGATLPLASPS